LIFEHFSKFCGKNSSFIIIWQEQRVLYVKTNINVWSYLAQFFLKWEMLQKKKVVEKIKIPILCSITFFRKLCHLRDVENYSRAGQATDDNMAQAHCIRDT
jgi:hypothetical protein